MIIFNELDIVSFKSIFKLKIDFKELEGKFYSLEGKNNTVDFAMSNGCGKSSLFDALAYSLYGTTMGLYIKKEEYQNKNTKIPMKLSLDFDITTGINKGNYIVVRTLDSTQLFKNNEDISELNKTDTEKKLANILNLTKEEFFSFTYLTQSAGGNFLNKTASEKLSVIKEFIFGEELSQIKLKIDNLLKDKKRILQDLKTESARIDGKLTSLLSLKDLTNDAENIDINELNENRQRLANLKQQQQEKRQQEQKKTTLNSELNNVKQQLSLLKKQIEQAKNKICPTCKQHLNDDSVAKELYIKAKELKQKGLQIKSDLENITNELNNLIDVDSEYNKLNRLIERQDYILNKQKQSSNIILNIEENKQLLQTLENNIIKVDQEIKQIASLQKYFNTIFIQYVQKSFLNEIENYLNLYCYEVFDDKFSLKFSNNSLDLFIGEHPYSYYSGGERQRIDLLFVFAIKVALSNFTDKCTNLLVFDESLSGSDVIAFDNTVELIDRLSSSSSLTTILISHRENNSVQNKIILERNSNNTRLEIFSV